MNDDRKNEIRAFLLTLLMVVLMVLLLLFTGLHYEYPPRDMDLVQLKQDSIMFGGEYVMLGNTPQPTESQEMDTENPETAQETALEPSVEGDDLEDAGEPAKQAAPPITAREPSPMKVKEKPKEEKPKKTGPATAQNETAKQEKVKKGTDAATDNRVKNSFGKSSGNGSGKQGSPEGNSPTGALSGKPGTEGLVGYTMEHWGRPHSRYTGVVRVRVRVNARGQVIEARAINGTGEAWSHADVRKDCEKETLKSAFSVPKNTTTEAVGIVIWRFV